MSSAKEVAMQIMNADEALVKVGESGTILASDPVRKAQFIENVKDLITSLSPLEWRDVSNELEDANYHTALQICEEIRAPKTETKFKNHIILMLESGTFKAHLITGDELLSFAFENMEDEKTDEEDALREYVETNLDDQSTIGWTELDTSNEKIMLQLGENVAELKTLLTQVNL